MSLFSGNIFSSSEKSGSILGQSEWENWVFPFWRQNVSISGKIIAGGIRASISEIVEAFCLIFWANFTEMI